MPALETYDRWQTAVYWAWAGTSAVDGDPQVSAPVDLQVRWGERQGVMKNAQGVDVATDAQIVVGQDVVENSIMWLGGLAMWRGTGSDADTDDTLLMKVVAFNKTPDIKGRMYYRTAGLVWFRDALPEVV